MAKKKVILKVEPRPQRSMKVKKIFDPSDNYLPKKRNKTSSISKKSNEISKNNMHEKKKHTKFNSNSGSESVDSLSINYTTTLLNSPSNSHVKHNSYEYENDVSCKSEDYLSSNSPEYKNSVSYKLDICSICLNNLRKQELVDCPICQIKAHKKCIIIEQPLWKYKFEKCSWICEQCRQNHCSKCLLGESQSEISRRCVTCKVGLHIDCFESYDIKPLQTIGIDMYICIPCMTLAVEKSPEEQDDNVVTNCSSVTSYSSSCKSSALNDEEDLESNTSLKLYDSDDDDDDDNQNNCSSPNIPDCSKWSKYEVYEYLSGRLPHEILAKGIKNEIDGAAIKLLKRTDITFGTDLKLGPAMKFYKEIRILQTQNTELTTSTDEKADFIAKLLETSTDPSLIENIKKAISNIELK